jgi:WD40 repeat protein
MTMLKILITITVIIGTLDSSWPKAKLKSLQHGQSSVVSVRFMRDGKSLLSASFDGTLVLWNLKTHKPLWKVDLDAKTKAEESHTISEILSMDVSPDGNTIAVAYNRSHVVGNTLNGKSEYRIGLLDSRDGREVRVVTGHTGLIGTVAFSPDGSLLASASSDFTARIWNVQTGEQVWSVKLKGLGKKVVFSPNGQLLAIGMLSDSPWQAVVEVRIAQNGRLEQQIEQGKANVSDIAFSPDGKFLAIATHDIDGSQVETWNVHRTEQKCSFIDKTDINSIAFSPNGGLLALGGSMHGKGKVIIRFIKSQKRTVATKSNTQVTDIRFSHDGSWLAVGTEKGEIKLIRSQYVQ